MDTMRIGRFLGLVGERPTSPHRGGPRQSTTNGTEPHDVALHVVEKMPRSDRSTVERSDGGHDRLLGQTVSNEEKNGLREPTSQRSTTSPQRNGAAQLGVWLGLVRPATTSAGPIHPKFQQRVDEVRREKNRWINVALGSALLVIIAVVAVTGALRSPIFALRTVAVNGATPAQEAVLRDQIQMPNNTNVLDVDLDQVETEIEALPWVEAAAVKRDLPSTITVVLVPRQSVIALEHPEGTYLLDDEGRVTELVTDGEPMTITAPVPVVEAPAVIPVVGEIISAPDVAAAARLSAEMPGEIATMVQSYRGEPNGEVVVELSGTLEGTPMDVTVHFGRPNEVRNKAMTLVALLEDTVGQGIPVHEVDVGIVGRPVVLR